MKVRLINGWSLVLAVIVLPVAIVAGFRFPVLLNLLGVRKCNIGLDSAKLYCGNTIGAILGALVIGFFLLPMVGVSGSWKISICLLIGLALFFLSLSIRRERYISGAVMVVGGLLLTIFFLASGEVSAVWLHSAIGAGRVDLNYKDTNQIKDWMHNEKRQVLWEEDGREFTLAMKNSDGLAFVINGKTDGNAVEDAGTQNMAPMVGALLHPQPKRAWASVWDRGVAAVGLLKFPG